MILGIGHDLVAIARIEKLTKRFQTPFISRLCTPKEQEHIHKRHNIARELAKLFAIKEAASKAIGTGIRQGVAFHDFERSYDAMNKPILSLSGAALAHAKKRSPKGFTPHIHLSYTDEKEMVSAVVILEARPC